MKTLNMVSVYHKIKNNQIGYVLGNDGCNYDGKRTTKLSNSDLNELRENRIASCTNCCHCTNIFFMIVSFYFWAETIAYCVVLTISQNSSFIEKRCGAPWINILLLSLSNVATAYSLYFSSPYKVIVKYKGELIDFFMPIRRHTTFMLILNALFRFWSLVVLCYLRYRQDTLGECTDFYLENTLTESTSTFFGGILTFIIWGISWCCYSCDMNYARHEEERKKEIENLRNQVISLQEKNVAIPIRDEQGN